MEFVCLAVPHFGCATTSYLGCLIPLQSRFVFPQHCVLPWDGIHVAARGLRQVVV